MLATPKPNGSAAGTSATPPATVGITNSIPIVSRQIITTQRSQTLASSYGSAYGGCSSSSSSNSNGSPKHVTVHTCGSLFAKCKCASTTTTSSTPPSTATSNSSDSDLQLRPRHNTMATGTSASSGATDERTQRRKTLFQSYSHPDTNFVFTDDNRNPLRATHSSPTTPHPMLPPAPPRMARGQSTAMRTKRMSTPCAPGKFSVLDVAVHPDLMLAFSHTNGQIAPISADVVTDVTEEEIGESVEDDGVGGATKPSSRRTSVTVPVKAMKKISVADAEALRNRNNLEYLKYSALGHQQQQQQQQQRREMGSADAGADSDERRDSFRTMESRLGGSSGFSRRISRSLGDPIRVEQLRQYAMRKQSECNENDYIRAQRQRTVDLEAEAERLKQTICDRDNEINKLKREIHKLKSVLQQTAAPASPDDDLLSSLQSHHRMPGQQSIVLGTVHSSSTTNLAAPANGNVTLPATTTTAINANGNGITNSSIPVLSTATSSDGLRKSITTSGFDQTEVSVTSGTTTTAHSNPQTPTTAPLIGVKPLQHPLLHALSLPSTAMKKQGVSGESSDTTGQQFSRDILIPKYEKDFRSKQLIKDAILDNDFLKNLDTSQVRELVDSMYGLEVRCGEYVIREGEAGAHLFVSAAGEFEVIQAGTVLGKMGEGKAFGELAILYNCTRTASIKVCADARLWVLDRRVFQAIMMRTGLQRIEENISFLRSVPLLQNLSHTLLAKIADVLEVEFYPAGTYVIRQGASGDTFFLISQGTVQVTQRLRDGQPANEEVAIRTLQRGDYFGEQALIKEDKRTANVIAMAPGVECLTLDRDSFSQLIGDLCELREKDYGDASRRVLAMKRTESKGQMFTATALVQEHLDIDIGQLEVVATLGIGGFGRVELVKHERPDAGAVQSFALKCLKKRHIVDTRQEEHVFSERTIMLSCRSPFICRLYRTYRDAKYVYMLLEACMGGEVWTILRDRGYFDDATAQFVIGSVLQAFEYLHSLGIVYRDLKPENLMLDERGYVKLVDFGFSKYIGYSGKTWTFCGTPEYVAPEIILNKGHDRAVDYWALGILIHELLTGSPPFNGSDPMKTYNIILKGIDMVDFPKHMSRSAVQLIKKLCRDIPAERLGYQRFGTQDIKKHKWFQNFDWDGLANQTIEPPIMQPISGPLDTNNFDDFPIELEEPPDELSGWDEGF